MGGAGFGVVEETLVFAELGRHAVPGPFLAGVIGARLAALEGRSDIAEGIIGGERVALCRADADSYVIYDAADATWWLLSDGDTVALAPAGDSIPFDGLDVLVPMARAPRSAAEPLVVAGDGRGLALRGALLASALLGGMARGTAEQSVGYALDREQFGQAIGGFQAVKHRCADMATRAESAECQTRYAALALAQGAPDAAFHVHAARVIAARAAIENAQVNVQNHGGIGFTWEHTAHRFVTRSRVVATQFGDTTDHLAELLTEPAPT